MTMSSGRRITGSRLSKSGPTSSAGRARLPTITGCTNSTETCSASVAAEPSPNASNRPPARNLRDISWQASARRGLCDLKKASKMLLRRSSSSLLRTARTFVSTPTTSPHSALERFLFIQRTQDVRGDLHLGQRIALVTSKAVDGGHSRQPFSTNPRQRVSDQHVYHARTAELGVHHDHACRLLAHLADDRGFFTALDVPQRRQGSVRRVRGDNGEELAFVGHVERVYTQDLARPVYDAPDREPLLPERNSKPRVTGELVQDRSHPAARGITHKAQLRPRGFFERLHQRG